MDAPPQWQQAVCREVRNLVHDANPDVTETIKYRPAVVELHGNIWGSSKLRGQVAFA
jgi:hypothetical protein